MKDLCEVMLNTQMDLGRNKEETSHLIEEHEKFENTAVVSIFVLSAFAFTCHLLKRIDPFGCLSNRRLPFSIILVTLLPHY